MQKYLLPFLILALLAACSSGGSGSSDSISSSSTGSSGVNTSSSSSTGSSSGNKPDTHKFRIGVPRALTLTGADTGNLGPHLTLSHLIYRKNLDNNDETLIATNDALTMERVRVKLGELDNRESDTCGPITTSAVMNILPSGITLTIKTGADKLWSYSLSCKDSNSEVTAPCDSILFDHEDHSVTFVDTQLEAASSQATAPLIINGSLTWSEEEQISDTARPITPAAQSDIEGIWDGTTVTGINGNDTFHYAFSANKMTTFDYQGDESGEKGNCYVIYNAAMRIRKDGFFITKDAIAFTETELLMERCGDSLNITVPDEIITFTDNKTLTALPTNLQAEDFIPECPED